MKRTGGSSLVLVAALVASSTARAYEESRFTPLFDGESLTGWVGATRSWEAVGGVLATRPDESGGLYTKRQYSDFVLRFEFRLAPGANNGIGLRAPLTGDAAYAGMECQVLDDTAPRYADLEPYQYHGSVYGVAAATRGALRPVGEWNSEEIRCLGRRVRVTLNGVVIVDVDLDESTPGGRTVDGRDHPGLSRSRGHLALLAHADSGRVEFRRIRVLDASQGGQATETTPPIDRPTD